MPGGVRRLLAARLGTLGDLARQVVAAAAVLGRSFDPAAVRDASGRSDEEVVIALEELLARGALVETDERTLDVRYEREWGLVQETTTLARRRLLRTETAIARQRCETAAPTSSTRPAAARRPS